MRGDPKYESPEDGPCGEVYRIARKPHVGALNFFALFFFWVGLPFFFLSSVLPFSKDLGVHLGKKALFFDGCLNIYLNKKKTRKSRPGAGFKRGSCKGGKLHSWGPERAAGNSQFCENLGGSFLLNPFLTSEISAGI